MKCSFTIKSPPFSINGAYYSNRGKTEACRYWQDGVIFELRKENVQKELQKILDAYDEKRHCFRVAYHFLLPKSKLLTAKNQISKRSADLTNIEKLLQDTIFEPRYSDRVRNLGINDGLVVDQRSSKTCSPDANSWIRIELELLETKAWVWKNC